MSLCLVLKVPYAEGTNAADQPIDLSWLSY